MGENIFVSPKFGMVKSIFFEFTIDLHDLRPLQTGGKASP